MDFGGFWTLFWDSLRFFTSIALGFVPKDPLGLDFKPKQNFKQTTKKTTQKSERFSDKFSNFFEILCWLIIGPQGVFWDETERNRRKKP